MRGGYRLRSLSAKPLVLIYTHQRGWSLQFVFPEGFSAPCSFTGAFVSRFLYFLGITRDDALSSFPAVLHLDG